MKRNRALAALAVALGTATAALAQGFPSRPVTMVVPFAAGGPVDTVARILAEPMRRSLGQPIVVESTTGAGGSLGVGRVARAAPDAKGFKLSRDPHFLQKLTDVVGLYLNPPEKALVICVDEKSQIQALDRTQPGLPLKKGRCGTMTPDYKRNGTTTLFAALEVAEGKVIGQCYVRHRHQEFLKFLQRLDAEFPGEITLHVVMDNYGTHKHPRVQRWLKRHERFVPHFVPTSSSWLNLVERWFGELTGKRIRRGVFVSVEDLEKAIEEFLAAWNNEPKPFV